MNKRITVMIAGAGTKVSLGNFGMIPHIKDNDALGWTPSLGVFY